MKAFLSKFANSKIWCGLFVALSLGLLILLVMEKSYTRGISTGVIGPIPFEFKDTDYMIK